MSVHGVGAAGGAGTGEISPVTPLGGNTYSLTVTAGHKFTRNTEKLKNEAVAAATDYCAKAGKRLQVVSVKENRSFYLVGAFPRAVLTFKALGPDDPESTVAAGAPEKTAAAAPLITVALYEDLLKLDDLRKKGILTEEESAAEKKKLLARSK